jgi:hypothetical protein
MEYISYFSINLKSHGTPLPHSIGPLKPKSKAFLCVIIPTSTSLFHHIQFEDNNSSNSSNQSAKLFINL